MKYENGLSRGSEERFEISVDGFRSFIEQFGIHLVLEVSIVGLIDGFLMNTVLSMLVGISLVEGCQWMWRKWRGVE
jgi:hypothetical protein